MSSPQGIYTILFQFGNFILDKQKRCSIIYNKRLRIMANENKTTFHQDNMIS